MAQPLSILYLAEYYPPHIMGGAELSLQALIESIVSHKSITCTILTPNYDSFSTQVEQKSPNLKIIRYRSFRYFLYRKRGQLSQPLHQKKPGIFYKLLSMFTKIAASEMAHRAKKLCNQNRFNIIHANNYESIEALNMITDRSDSVTIGHIRDMRFFSIDRSQPGKKNLYPNIHHFIAISNYLKQMYLNATDRNNVTTIYNQIDLPDISSKSKATLRKQLHLPAKNIILYLGSLVPEKGAHLIPEIAKQCPDCFFAVIGSGSLQTEFENMNIPNMKLFGQLPPEEAQKFLASSDITLVPSQVEEGFGRTVAESQLSGSVVIASKIGAIPELISNGKTGFLIDKDDIPSFASHIKHLISNPRRMSEIAKQAKKSALPLCNTSENVINLYNNLLENN